MATTTFRLSVYQEYKLREQNLSYSKRGRVHIITDLMSGHEDRYETVADLLKALPQ